MYRLEVINALINNNKLELEFPPFALALIRVLE